jgi:hypothetical protein
MFKLLRSNFSINEIGFVNKNNGGGKKVAQENIY